VKIEVVTKLALLYTRSNVRRVACLAFVCCARLPFNQKLALIAPLAGKMPLRKSSKQIQVT